jgi:hypothetical protein
MKAKKQEAQPKVPLLQLELTEPLFGVTKVAGGKYLAVAFVEGVATSLTPKRGGKDSGEALHFATARVMESFKASVLGRRA